MSDEEFDAVVGFFRSTGARRHDTRIDANPACPGDMISALSEGNAEEIWALMERTLCYFPACLSAPRTRQRIPEDSGAPSESTRAGADTETRPLQPRRHRASPQRGDAPVASERPKEAEGRQRRPTHRAPEREAAPAGYIRFAQADELERGHRALQSPGVIRRGPTAEYTRRHRRLELGAVDSDAMEGKVVFFMRSGLYSTLDMIVGLLLECPDRPRKTRPWRQQKSAGAQPDEREPAKRVALSLLAFQASERLTAEELLETPSGWRRPHDRRGEGHGVGTMQECRVQSSVKLQ
ncbi:hypothetical protein Q5P01_000125 [Channa striata]|uniref:Uncharacterized protein n=1 Tax=Channa striata TaxID=64152 RepID=A0AA88IY54_CHASR|nr:hypothetical protein Q5P01_000125 [Channa striata]